MSVRDQARRVLASLEAKPDLLFEVLRLVYDEFLVAGPWEQTGPGMARRKGPSGGLMGNVKPQVRFAGPAGPPFVWEFDGGNGVADTFLEACHALDLALTADGYLLAGGICQPS